MKTKHNLEAYERSAKELQSARSELTNKRNQLARTKEISKFIGELSAIRDDTDIQVANKLDGTIDGYIEDNREELQENKGGIDRCVVEVREYMSILQKNIENAKLLPEGYGNEKQKYIDSARQRCRRIEELLKGLLEEGDSLNSSELCQVRDLLADYKELKDSMIEEGFSEVGLDKEPAEGINNPDYTLGDNGISVNVQDILSKETFTDADRAAIRTAIMQGKMGEHDVRIIGSRVRAKYDQNIYERNREFDYLEGKKRELAIRFNNATTDEERAHISTEVLILKQREQQYREKYAKSSMIKQVIEEYRSVGPTVDDKGQLYDQGFFNSSKTVMEAINSIRDYLPTDWVNRSNAVPIITKHVNRGYFNIKDGKPTIALSSSGSGMQRCAFHEMGHFFEDMYPEIRKLEYQFYNRRTAGEELRWLGAGYSRSEVTRYDNFVEPYMGKDYGNTESSGFEIFSMGMEAIFAGSYNLSRDTEYQDLILGILVSI